MLRSPLRPLLRKPMQGLIGPGPYTLVKKAIGILRKYGTNAHIYLPGVGTVNGITAGNYLDSAGTTSASVDNPVGLVVDSFGAINATQGTTANKPILRRGLLNLGPYSHDVANAYWTKTAIPAPTTGLADPWGGTTAQKIVATAVSTNHYLSPSGGGYPAANITCTHAIVAKSSGESVLGFGIAGGTAFSAVFDLVAGTATPSGTTTEIRSLGNGWYLCVIVATPTAYASTPYITIRATQTTFVGDGVSGLLLAGIGLFQGTYTAQQIIDAGGIPLTTSAAASSTTGKYWWQFDGSNDSLSLGAPLFQMSDDHCVIAGFNGAVSDKYIFSQNNTAALTLVGSIRINFAGAPNALWQDDTAALVNIASSTSCIGANTVATAVKIGNAKRLRVNGVQQGATNNTVLGATTLNNYAIGSYTTGGYFQGSIYPVIAIKGTVSDAELMVLEKYVGMCCGVSI